MGKTRKRKTPSLQVQRASNSRDSSLDQVYSVAPHACTTTFLKCFLIARSWHVTRSRPHKEIFIWEALTRCAVTRLSNFVGCYFRKCMRDLRRYVVASLSNNEIIKHLSIFAVADICDCRNSWIQLNKNRHICKRILGSVHSDKYIQHICISFCKYKFGIYFSWH